MRKLMLSLYSTMASVEMTISLWVGKMSIATGTAATAYGSNGFGGTGC